MNGESIKRQVGLCLFEACERVPRLKPFLRRWGLRTSKEWFAGRAARVQMSDGRRLMLASIAENYLSFELFWRGAAYYEPITTLVAGELVGPGDTFIDVGANIGFYSLVLSAMRPGLKGIAFEPNPKNFAMLQANVHSNGLRKIVCESMALSDKDSTASLYLSPSDMSASLETGFDSQPTGRVEVRTTTLDNYLTDRPIGGRPLIKVDVEGHEAAFFRGAQETLALRQPDVIAEVAVSYDSKTSAFLREIGYSFYPITDGGLVRSDALTPVIKGQFVFLNYLLSTRPEQEIAGVFGRIREQVGRIDLAQTSKFRSEEAIREFHALQLRHRADSQSFPLGIENR